MREDFVTEVLEMFEVGFGAFAQEQAFETWNALAIVATDLDEQPVGLAAAPGAAEADSGWAIRFIACTSGSAGHELFDLQIHPFGVEVEHLVLRAAEFFALLE